MSLLKLRNTLKKHLNPQRTTNYHVPDLWNCWNYNGILEENNGLLKVDPYQFYHDAIMHIFSVGNYAQLQPTNSESPQSGGDWIKQATVYSMMVRTSTSWDHDLSQQLEDTNSEGFKEAGTFVKTLALLPLLKKLGVSALYLLPLSKFSLKDKKGDLGSPYAVQDFFELDPHLKDPMTGDDMTLEEEFSALVEACHLLDIKVLIDIIPRTNSVDSALIREHPDWFYWIKKSELASYAPPKVEGLGATLPPLKKYLSAIYASPSVRAHLGKFQWAPNISDLSKWEAVLKRGGSVSDHIKKEFGLVVAPAFSDHINDIQPAWTDVTFFRLYLDHPADSQKYVAKNQPPYVLFDTIKANIHEGHEPNLPLWELLSDIIPYYQEKFGIDGARIDMGHALPVDLIDQIVSKARLQNPDFALIAEELDRANADVALAHGYNMIIGDGFVKEPRVKDYKCHAFMYDVPRLSCPVFACGETHDTPRLAAREGGRTLAKMLSVMNYFLPNGVPFINSGQEVYEVQPMNMGLDCYDGEQRRLPKSDPFYEKLALFDKFAIHYLNEGRWDLPDHLEAVAKIRNAHLETFTNLAHYVPLGFDAPTDPAVGFGFVEASRYGWHQDNVFVVVASTDMEKSNWIRVNLQELRVKSGNIWHSGRLLYSTHEWERDVYEFDEVGDLHLFMAAGEVKVIKV